MKKKSNGAMKALHGTVKDGRPNSKAESVGAGKKTSTKSKGFK